MNSNCPSTKEAKWSPIIKVVLAISKSIKKLEEAKMLRVTFEDTVPNMTKISKTESNTRPLRRTGDILLEVRPIPTSQHAKPKKFVVLMQVYQLQNVRAILGNADVTEAGSVFQLLQHDYWGTSLLDSGSHGSWRPLCVLSFRLDFHLGHGDAFSFHLINQLLHCLATALVLFVARTLLPTSRSRVTARVAAALFASHPIHTEAVAGLVGRADLAACVCCLLAYLAYHHHMLHSRKASSLALTLLFALGALLSKETGIVTLVLCGLCDVLRGCQQRYAGGRKHRLRSLTILSIFLLCSLYCRLCLVPRPTANFSAADNPTAHESSWWTRTLTFLYLPALNLQLLLFPHQLSFDWGMEAIPRIRTLCDARNLLSFGFYATLLALTCQGTRLCRSCINYSIDYATVSRISLPFLQRLGCNSCCWAWHGFITACNHQLKEQLLDKRTNSSMKSFSASQSSSDSRLLISIAFLVLPFLPACNLFFYVGFVLAERLLYLPSVGYCLLLSFGFGKLWQRLPGRNQRLLLLCCLGLVLSTFSLRTVQRNRDWHNEEQLFRSAVAINPPKALGNLGSVLSSQRRFEEAKLALEAAIRHRPNMADVHFNLGMVHQQQLNYSAALPFYRRAIELRPQLAVAYLNLATSLLACRSPSSHEEAEAEALLLTGARLRGRGVRDRNAHVAARHSAYQQLSALHHSRGKLPQAVQVLQEALSMPQSVAQRAELHQRLAALHVELQQFAAAEEQQLLVLQLQPEQAAACVHYGQLLARNSSRYAEAQMWFKRALQLSPLEASVHHHYADFLEQREHPQEALVYRLRAASLSPHDYALHAAVADALRLLHRLAEAELWYRQATALHPRSARAHANLGAILQLRGKRQQAAECYRRALQLQPGHATSLANLAKMSGNIDANT